MLHIYDPFVLRRTAEGRVFLVNATMPFEYFLHCFRFENPLFIVARLDDGRVAITPNAACIPWSFAQEGYWPQGLLPDRFEYVTMKNGAYPVIVSAHPIADFDGWYRMFERGVIAFAKETLLEFVTAASEFRPLPLPKPQFERAGAGEKIVT